MLLIVLDTLRADHVSAYGYERKTTPHLDALAGEALLFEDAMAPSPATAPSHASLFTSTPPAVHGVWNSVTIGDRKTHPKLAPESITLAEVMRDAGYQTAAVADGGWVTAYRGLDQGFQTFDSVYSGVRDRADRALKWLQSERDPERPFFLFFHTYEVHTPLVAEPGYVDRFMPEYQGPLRVALEEARNELAASPGAETLEKIHERYFAPHLVTPSPADLAFYVALYDARLVFADEQVARLTDWLRSAGLWDDTITIVTSDHGEEFMEHGEISHRQLYQECLHIPLIVRTPGGPRGVRRNDGVELLDVMPSVLAGVGIAAPETAAGRDIGLSSATAVGEPRPRAAEWVGRGGQLAWRSGSRKVIFTSDGTREPMLFDLTSDARERNDLAATAQAGRSVADARDWLGAWRDRCDAHAREYSLAAVFENTGGPSEANLRQLRALGYVD